MGLTFALKQGIKVIRILELQRHPPTLVFISEPPGEAIGLKQRHMLHDKFHALDLITCRAYDGDFYVFVKLVKKAFAIF